MHNPRPSLRGSGGEAPRAPRREPTPPCPYDEDQLVRLGLPLVDAVAKRLWLRWGCRLELDELAAMGRAALVSLVRAYDPARAPLVPYLVPRLGWAIRDGVRSHTHARAAAVWRSAGTAAASRRSEARERSRAAERGGPGAGVPFDDGSGWPAERLAVGGHRQPGAATAEAPAPLDGRFDPERHLLERGEQARLREAVASLPRRERLLVVGHYFQDRRFDHVADELGVSKSWASRLHRRALRRLRCRLRGGPAAPVPRVARPHAAGARGAATGRALPADPDPATHGGSASPRGRTGAPPAGVGG